MKSMFTVTSGGRPVSVVVSSNGDDAVQMTKRLLELQDDCPSDLLGVFMRARRPTHDECDKFFARQRVWVGQANVAGFLL